jgi:hypothetical protein
MTKLFALVFTLLAFTVTAPAQTRSQQEVKQIALQKLQKLHGIDGSLHRAQELNTIEVLKQDPMYTILGSDNSGFVVVSNDQRLRPVLAYSDQFFDFNDIPCGMKWWLNAISQVLARDLASGKTDNALSHRASKIKVEPFLTCKWNQRDPFNKKCPAVDDKGTLPPSGCVATALAQVLYYYKYPDSSEGEGYYTISDGIAQHYVELNSTYDWTLYEDTYFNPIFLPEEKKEAIAQLLYDCGVAVHMNYDAKSSGAILSRTGAALSHNFKCDSLAVRALERKFCGNEEWMQLIRAELEAGRPILYGGQDAAEGGHAFVLHGIDEEDNVFVNWGWSGKGDCWTAIDVLTPEGENSSFSEDQSMVIGLRTNPVPTEEEEYKSTWGVTVAETLSQSVFKRLKISDFTAFNIHHLTFYGVMGLYFEKTDGSERYLLPFLDTSKDFEPVQSGTGYSFDSSEHLLAELSVGTYYAYFASKAIQEPTYQALRQIGGKYNVYTITIHEDRSVTIDKKEETDVLPTAIHPISYSSDAATTRYYDLQGRELNGPSKGLVIRKQGNTVRKVIIK